MSKHTSGPWKMYPSGNRCYGVKATALEIPIVTGIWRIPIDVQRANAQLISKAPELLDAAKDFANYLENNGDKGILYSRIRKLIAEAEGVKSCAT